MKVIFLDIDGVINSHDNIWARTALWKTKQIPSRDDYGQLFDERCVRLLEWIIDKTDAKIVISSTWRMSGLIAMQNMWKDRSLPGEVIDVTPTRIDAKIYEEYQKEEADRGYEIQAWINENNPSKYCILDDDVDMLKHQFFVNTNTIIGLTYKDAKEVIKILK